MANGSVLIVPSSVVATGGTASISANGGVTFTSITKLSVNGCFTSEYKRYCLAIGVSSTSSSMGIQYRFRSSGTDISTGEYNRQYLLYLGAVVADDRNQSQTQGSLGGMEFGGGIEAHISYPALAQYKAGFNRGPATTSTEGGATYYAYNAKLATAYDGITIGSSTITPTITFTGTLSVIGYVD